MPYQVQRGDTIAKVTDLMNMHWRNLRRTNPQAVGRCPRTGHWFLKEGAVIKRGGTDFQTLVDRKKDEITASQDILPEKTEGWTEYTLKTGDTLWDLAVKRFHVRVEDLIKDNGITDPKRLRPGRKIRIRLPSYPPEEDVVASWYGRDYHGRPMANGEFFNMYANTIAHKDLPLGTRVELENPATGKRVTAVVTDRGPYIEGRDVDLSYGLARMLSLVDKGVGKLKMRVLG